MSSNGSLNRFGHSHQNEQDVYVLNKEIKVSNQTLSTLGDNLDNMFSFGNIKDLNKVLEIDYSNMVDSPVDYTHLDIAEGTQSFISDGVNMEFTVANVLERYTKVNIPKTNNGLCLMTWKFRSGPNSVYLKIDYGIKGLDSKNESIFETSMSFTLDELVPSTRTVNFKKYDNANSLQTTTSTDLDYQGLDVLDGSETHNLYMVYYNNVIEFGMFKGTEKIIFNTTYISDESWQYILKPYIKVESFDTGTAALVLNSISCYTNYNINELSKRKVSYNTEKLLGNLFKDVPYIAIKANRPTMNVFFKSVDSYAAAAGANINVLVDYENNISGMDGAFVNFNGLEVNTTLTTYTGGINVGNISFNRQNSLSINDLWYSLGFNSMTNTSPVILIITIDNLTNTAKVMNVSINLETI